MNFSKTLGSEELVKKLFHLAVVLNGVLWVFLSRKWLD